MFLKLNPRKSAQLFLMGQVKETAHSEWTNSQKFSNCRFRNPTTSDNRTKLEKIAIPLEQHASLNHRLTEFHRLLLTTI